jgi:hypothetical protein
VRFSGRERSSKSSSDDSLRLLRELLLEAEALESRRGFHLGVIDCDEEAVGREELRGVLAEDGPREEEGSPSSLERSCSCMRGVCEWTRACRRMLLSTLKLRPQLSTGQMNASKHQN